MSHINGKGPPTDRTRGSVGDTYTNLNTGVKYILTDVHVIQSDREHFYYTWVQPGTEIVTIDELPVAEDTGF